MDAPPPTAREKPDDSLGGDIRLAGGIWGDFGLVLVWFPKLSVLGVESDVDTIELSLNLPPNLSVNVIECQHDPRVGCQHGDSRGGIKINVNTIVSLNLPLNLNVNMVIIGAELNVNRASTCLSL